MDGLGGGGESKNTYVCEDKNSLHRFNAILQFYLRDDDSNNPPTCLFVIYVKVREQNKHLYSSIPH